MSVAPRPLQQVRPSSEPELWTGYNDPNGGIRNDVSRDEIARIVASGDGTLWVDIDTRDPNDVSILSDVFHFHPLAIEEATNPQSRVKLEEYDKYLLLIVRTVGFCETTDDPYDLAPALTVPAEPEPLAEKFMRGLVWKSPGNELLVHDHDQRTLLGVLSIE